MAIHETPTSMLKESLDETLEAARLCIEYEKTNPRWGSFTSIGCLGYPGAILLFSLIDSIGSYFRKNTDFLIEIDGTIQNINEDGWEHFKILNSKYFGQKLSSTFIKQLYIQFRSYLTHNSVLGKSSLMLPNNTHFKNAISNKAFIESKGPYGNIVYIISLKELWDLCKVAVEEFKKDIDTVVPNSKQGKNFH